MRVKTSITLDHEILASLDEVVAGESNRSRIVETAVREYLERWHRDRREARDREILDQTAEELDREMEEVLAFQVET